MVKETCELCGDRIELKAVEKHHIVPIDVTVQAGMPESKIVELCRNCHREVHAWYSVNVLDKAYSAETKQFRQKSVFEMIKEYEAAYRVFAAYKKGQRERA